MPRKTDYHDSQLDPAQSLPEALGQSEAFLDFQQELSRIAPVDRPVLIVGERGTGKELVASRLHFLSRRWQGPLIALNCAALSPSLLESELFGHEAGAFTGARQLRRGRFEAASGGTLFLDEIGLIPIEVQEKILRAVEYNMFERVGASEPIRVDTRIVGATNADLPALVREGRFKADLLDRLAFEVLNVPPLRERRGDIPMLARHFAARMALELGREEPLEFSDKVLAALETHPWPGNIRELKNTVERAVYRAAGATVESVVFDPFASVHSSRLENPIGPNGQKKASPDGSSGQALFEYHFGDSPLNEAVKDLESAALREALARSKFHQGDAAKLLGLSYHQFRALYRKYKPE